MNDMKLYKKAGQFVLDDGDKISVEVENGVTTVTVYTLVKEETKNEE